MIFVIVICVIILSIWFFWPLDKDFEIQRPHHPQKYSDLPENHPDVQNFYKESLANKETVKKYTELGYKKTKIPKKIFEYLKNACETTDRIKENVFPRSSSGPPPYLIVIPESKKTWITNTIQPILEQWIGIPLKHEATYGMRGYRKGSSLRMHVDRDNHVISAILHIGRECQGNEVEKWPLRVIGHDTIEKNIYMEPGDLVLYESRSVMHGRPEPCPCFEYINLFVHFSPIKNESRRDSFNEVI